MKQFHCFGDVQEAFWDRLDADETQPDRLLIHHLVDGHRLYEVHGRKDGFLCLQEPLVMEEGDWLLCCYPRRVKQRFPEAPVACDYHDGVIISKYGFHPRQRGRGRYTVTAIPAPNSTHPA